MANTRYGPSQLRLEVWVVVVMRYRLVSKIQFGRSRLRCYYLFSCGLHWHALVGPTLVSGNLDRETTLQWRQVQCKSAKLSLLKLKFQRKTQGVIYR